MKRIYTLAIALFASVASILAQAPVPVPLYSFDVPFPNSGWSDALLLGLGTGNTTYTTAASCHTIPAAKLDNTGEYIQIWLAGQAGDVKYWIKGSTSNNAPFSGTFSLEESANGTTWTPLHTFTNTALSTSTFTQITDSPLAATRYLRWFFTNKVSGSNISLDDIEVAAPILQVPEINMSQSNSALLTNGYASAGVNVGDSIDIVLNIQNAGTAGGNLTIGASTITGAFASEYTVITSPTAIPSLSNQNLTIRFRPLANGSRPALLSIPNNDSDENPFIVNLNGTGGLFVTEPANQPTNLILSSIKSFRINASFTATTVDNFGGYLVIKSKTPIPSSVYPSDGHTYQRGDTVQGYKVIYNGNGTSFVASEVYANTTYYFYVWAYNGLGATRNYLQSNPLTANAITPATMMPASYYSNINTSSPNFLTNLTTKCNIIGRNKIYYGNYASTMMKLFASTDTSGGQKVATCVYSGDKFLYTGTMTWSYMSREHSYCHNWMPTDPADGTGASPLNYEHPEYNDQHHLFPTNQNDVNAVRSNNPMGKVVTVQSTFLDSKVGLDSSGHKVFEPRDSQKGKTARAIMYMAVAYNNSIDSSGATYNWKFRNPISTSIPYGQDQSILKRWNAMYPPDSYEISRNDFLDSLQGNRNPFVDHPEYACYIDFSSMTYLATPSTPCYNDVNAPCGIVEQLTTDSITNTSVKLTWASITSATNYTVQYRKTGTLTWTNLTSSTNSIIITGLTINTGYTYRVYATCPSGAGAATTNQAFSTADVGFIELTSASVSITPNPSNGNFKVITNIKTGTTLNVSIIDIAGRTCFTENKNISSSSFDVNTNGLKAGVYTLRLSNKNGVANHKIVIE